MTFIIRVASSKEFVEFFSLKREWNEIENTIEITPNKGTFVVLILKLINYSKIISIGFVRMNLYLQKIIGLFESVEKRKSIFK